ncbi:MAG: hypothetical protein AAGD32_00350 [Planctomycetota bacterium]
MESESKPTGNVLETRTLALHKGEHEHRFRYEPGDERSVLDAVIGIVGDTTGKADDAHLDWFDAAVLSHQLGEHLAKELEAIMPKKAA